MKTVICNFAPQDEEMDEVRLTFVTDEFKQSGNQISYITVSRLDDIGYDRTYVANGIDELQEILDKLNIINPMDVGTIREAFLTNKLFRKKFFCTWQYTEDELEADLNCMQDALIGKFYENATNVFGVILESRVTDIKEDTELTITNDKMCEVLNYIEKEGRMGDYELYDYDFDFCLPRGFEIDKTKGFEGFEWNMNTWQIKVHIKKLPKEEKAEIAETKLTKEDKAELFDTLDAFGLI